ncbi:MAG TPA: hypothetical protein VGZ47_07985 [Gemmataceae bacterium]|jgi:ElaB/YqjD/DUF883 family membrane-anchored ribosome-binding protein|nr:hypothetical protein [Gemmataceae bacterium]
MANMNPAKPIENPFQQGDGLKKEMEELGGKAKGLAEKAGETASRVGERAEEMASSAMHKARDAAGKAEEKADRALGSMGKGMESLAGTIREKAPHEGALGTASSRVAETLDSSGRYLEQHGVRGIADDLTDVIRRNPIPAICIGVACGFLIGRAFRR